MKTNQNIKPPRDKYAAVALAIVTAWMVVLVLILINGCTKAEMPEPEQPKLHKISPANLIPNGGGEGTTDWEDDHDSAAAFLGLLLTVCV